VNVVERASRIAPDVVHTMMVALNGPGRHTTALG
jgi:hypothetical protein